MLIRDFLLQYQLPISKRRGQAYDSASNMNGVIKGAAQRIQNEEESTVYMYVRCLAHSLNLSLLTLAKHVGERSFRPNYGAWKVHRPLHLNTDPS